jgi:hypothetical protein
MYIEERYPTTEEDLRPWTAEELQSLKKAKQKTKTAGLVKVTASGIDDYKNEIVAILQKAELTSKDLATRIRIEVNATSFNAYLKKLNGIRTRKSKGSLFFTMKPEEMRLF